MKKEKHWEYKNAKDFARMLADELVYTHKMDSLIGYAEEEAEEAMGEWESFEKFYRIGEEIESYSATLISICDMLFNLRLDYYGTRRSYIRKEASRIAYEIFNNMNMAQKKKSGALKRLAKMYEEEFLKKEKARPSKRAMVDPSSVSINPKSIQNL